MRWGERSAKSGSLSWVRPLHSIVATFGLETEEPEVVKFAIDGIEAGRPPSATASWRRRAITVRRFEDYEAKLETAKVVLDPSAARTPSSTDAKQLAFAQGLRPGRGPGAAGRGRRPGRMAGRADGIVRRGISVDPGRGDPRHHPQQPEMFCGARSQDREAHQQVHPHRQHRGDRRRQDHHRRQRARDPRAAVGCEILLRDRPEDEAGSAAAEIRSDRLSREARHAGRAHQARSSGWRRRSRRWSAPMSRRPSAPRIWRRPICSPRSSANSPNCRA